MREFLLRLRVPLLLGVLLLGALGSMLLERTGAGPGAGDRGYVAGLLLEIAAPLQKAVAWPADAARGAYRRYLDLLGLRAENEALRTQVADLLEENLQFREALVDGGRLANIVAMREDFEVPLLPAQVVGQDVSPWFRSVLVDRGNANQLRAGMPVVTEHGVAGVLRATSPHAARAMLLLDRQSAIDGIVQRSRARGIVRGTGSGELEFVFVVRGDDVEAGDVVISSGLGGVYPKGLRIGDVVQVSRDEASLLHTARVRPAVDFGSLEQVFVMLWRGPEMALLYGGEGDSRAAPEESTRRQAP